MKATRLVSLTDRFLSACAAKHGEMFAPLLTVLDDAVQAGQLDAAGLHTGGSSLPALTYTQAQALCRNSAGVAGSSFPVVSTEQASGVRKRHAAGQPDRSLPVFGWSRGRDL